MAMVPTTWHRLPTAPSGTQASEQEYWGDWTRGRATSTGSTSVTARPLTA